LIDDDEIEDIVVMVAVKNLVDEKNKADGSHHHLSMHSLEPAIGNEMIMNDYFTDVPIYLANPFHR
jgi:hypothetical protein